MLILSRKSGQEIVVGGDIRIRVLQVRGNRVRLGFDAPGEVSIQRAELLAAECTTSQERRTSVDDARRSQMLLPSA